MTPPPDTTEQTTSSQSPPSPLITTEKDQTTPLSAEFYTSLGSSYQAAFAQDPSLQHFLTLLLAHLTPHSHILDLGSGTGHPISTTLASHGHQITGIDISPEMIRLSSQAVPSGSFEVADMSTYEPPNGTKFDAILSILSLFAFDREQMETQITKWTKWVKPGGLICICSLPAEDFESKGRFDSKTGYDDDGLCARDVINHFMGKVVKATLFTTAGWREVLKRNGLEIVDEFAERYNPPVESGSEDELHYFVFARKG